MFPLKGSRLIRRLIRRSAYFLPLKSLEDVLEEAAGDALEAAVKLEKFTLGIPSGLTTWSLPGAGPHRTISLLSFGDVNLLSTKSISLPSPALPPLPLPEN